MKSLQLAVLDGAYTLDLKARDLPDALRQIVDSCVAKRLVPEKHRQTILDRLDQRERESSSALGDALAVPHAYFDFLDRQVIFFARLDRPLALGAPDGVPTRYLYVLLGPTGLAEQHLDLLMQIARLMSDRDFRYDIGEAESRDALLTAFEAFERRGTPPSVPGPAEISEGLRPTRRPFEGLVADIRRRAPLYWKDFEDGFHPKALGSILFLYFACLAPAVTFGGLMSTGTGGRIGAVEMLVATTICGVVYALFSGQPLTILGGTGPLLVMTEVLYLLCLRLEIPFLPAYAWVGLWTALLMWILAVTGASSLVRFLTRFVDEIFAALISLIFIVEAVTNVLAYFDDEGGTPVQSALLSLLIALGTFYVATSLSRIRKSRFLHAKMREFLADFGATIAVGSMAFVAYFFFHEVPLQALDVPTEIRTTSGRAWAVDLKSVPTWVMFAAFGPAFLTTILVYLDQNITARLVNAPEHKLKGEAYHLDLAVVGSLIGFCSFFGLPWLVAATVRSLNHLRSLATTEEVVSQTGDKRDRIIHVRENRVTALVIHLLIGASLLLLPYLRLIPMPVLYGLFFFMGVVSISGNQFFERLSLWVIDTNRYPSNHYTRRVPRPVIHLFTLLQAACLGLLWVIKVSALGILFPLFIALLVPVRLIAGKWFDTEHLLALDAAEDPDAEDMAPEAGP